MIRFSFDDGGLEFAWLNAEYKSVACINPLPDGRYNKLLRSMTTFQLRVIKLALDKPSKNRDSQRLLFDVKGMDNLQSKNADTISDDTSSLKRLHELIH